MQKTVLVSTLFALAALGSTLASAQTTTPAPAPGATPPAAAAPAATPPKVAARKHKRHARHHRRARVLAHRCFGHEWRAFPTMDPKGYFYAPAGGGIC